MPALSRPARLPVLALALFATLLLGACQTPRTSADGTVHAAADDRAPARGFLAPRSTAAVTGQTPAADCCASANLWDRMRAGFRFDLDQDNDRIAAQRNWYMRNQAYLDRVCARAARYMHYIVEEAEARDMPLELALLPVVESAFDPYAYSVAHAAGPWQFIPSTGRVFGLKQDWWYDGRRDIQLSTHAALSYLEQLANRFDGDYYKALASYNAGGGTVSRAITKNLRAGKKTDYWSLTLPQETRAYVPKLVALAQIVRDPARYGMRLNPIPDRPAFASVEVGRQIDLARAAELADMPLAELHLYNPGHNRWATDPQGPRHLLVPVEVAERLKAGLAAMTDDAYAVVATHTVESGDTLEGLAERYTVSADSIRMLNNLAGDELPPAGSALQIPQPYLRLATADDTYVPRVVALNHRLMDRSANAGNRLTRYQVRSGDTLSGIARKHHIDQRELARWNGMRINQPLRIGQELMIKGGSSNAQQAAARSKSGQQRVQHRVKPGETLYGVARKFRVSVHDIARWNDFSPNRQLRAGEVLRIFRD